MRCSHCDQVLRTGATFCSHCGVPVRSVDPTDGGIYSRRSPRGPGHDDARFSRRVAGVVGGALLAVAAFLPWTQAPFETARTTFGVDVGFPLGVILVACGVLGGGARASRSRREVAARRSRCRRRRDLPVRRAGRRRHRRRAGRCRGRRRRRRGSAASRARAAQLTARPEVRQWCPAVRGGRVMSPQINDEANEPRSVATDEESGAQAPLGADNDAPFDPGQVWNDTVHAARSNGTSSPRTPRTPSRARSTDGTSGSRRRRASRRRKSSRT